MTPTTSTYPSQTIKQLVYSYGATTTATAIVSTWPILVQNYTTAITQIASSFSNFVQPWTDDIRTTGSIIVSSGYPVEQRIDRRSPQRPRISILSLDAKLALEKAKRLLYEHLDAEQIQCLEQNGYFDTVSKSNRKYRIYEGNIRNIRLLDDHEKAIKTYCTHPADTSIPFYDTMLAQKVMLELCEDHLLSIANKMGPDQSIEWYVDGRPSSTFDEIQQAA